MIETIRIGHLLRETATSPYRHLVTRPTGAAVRHSIEVALSRSDCLTALLDFSDIELLDFSCAEEIVAKLLLAQASDWAFIMKTGTTVEYAKKRTRDHVARFTYLYRALKQEVVLYQEGRRRKG